MFWKIVRQIGKYKKAAVMAVVFTALEVAMEVLIPYATALIIDRGIEAGDLGKVYTYGGLMVAMAALSLTFGIIAGRCASTASTGLSYNLRDKMFTNIQTFAFSNIDRFSTAGLVTRMTTDVTNIQNASMMTLRIAVRSPLMFICSVIMCVLINVELSAIFLVAIVVLGVAVGVITKKTYGLFIKVFNQYDDVNASIQENISAIRVVKAFVREKFENKKYGKAVEKLYQLFVKAETTLMLVTPAMMLVMYGCMISLSWFGAKFIVAGDLTTGELTSMFTYIMSILMSLMMLSMVIVMIAMSSASAERIIEVLEEKPDMENPEKPVMEMKDGSIDFENVDFSYKKGSGDLRNIDLHIDSGETIGVIGGTGSGKSSLIGLISRLYDVSEGSLKVGGVDVREYDIDMLRNNVSVVLQNNVLFSGTILDNLRWGNENATEEECREACRLACADEFIEKMPDKYETMIERGGSNVSGGQKQRLCIARALLKNPKVIILDDSTSAVDTATDKKIKEAFASKLTGVTKIIIAQRVASVEGADRIIVMDDGTVNSFDTHENLLKNNEIYREIYEVQTKFGGDFDEPQADSDGEVN